MSTLYHIDFEVPAWGETGPPVAWGGYRERMLAMGPVTYHRLRDAGSVAIDEMGSHPGTHVGVSWDGGDAGGGPLGYDPGATPSYDGVGSYTQAAGVYPVLGGAPRSIVAWVRFDKASLSGSFRRIAGWGRGQVHPEDDRKDCVLRVRDTGRVSFEAYWCWVSGTAEVGDDRWHMIAASYPGGPMSGTKLYVDGVVDPVAEGFLSHLSLNTQPFRPLSIGGPGLQYTGRIAEVATFSKAVTGAEIASLYRVARGGGWPGG